MRNRTASVVAGLIAICGAWSLVAQEPASRPASPFAAEAYLEHIKYLASDDLEGRQPGTEGIELAAEYIARHFADAGLEPAGDDGTYFQTFEVKRGKKLVDGAAVLKVDGIDRQWQFRKDWIALPFSDTDEVEGPLAFAGYGISASAYEYDDYKDFDATDKVLLIFRYEPRAQDPEAAFGGKTPSRYAEFARKARVAYKEGAKALLIVNPPQHEPSDDTLFVFDEDLSNRTCALPMVHVSRELAQALLDKAGLGTLAELQAKLERERKPLSADMNLHITLKPGIRPNKLAARNVVGRLKGTGDTTDTIVIGAHYDHLGNVPSRMGGADEPQIHNGADDNASGTAGVLEMARVLAKEPKLRRDVIFVAFSAEEMGLLGSAHFVDHPPTDLKNIRAMVNFDMIGRLGTNKLTVYGVPSGSGLADLVNPAVAQAGLECSPAQGGMFGASDHATFYAHDIPVLFAFTGVHKQYHTPDDDWELIDAEGATKVLTAFHQIVRAVADLETGPEFAKVVPQAEPEPPIKPEVEHEKEAQDKDTHDEPGAHRHHGPPGPGGDAERPTRPPVRLGIMPDFTGGDKPGVGVTSVLDGGPAKAAGMQDGDRIVKIGGEPVKDIYGYMDALREFKPGATIEIVVVRKDEELTLKLTLQDAPKPRGAQ